MRRGVRKKANVRVLRLLHHIPNRQAIAASTVKTALQYRGRGYWISGAIRSILGNRGVDTTGRMFCSYFVAQAYEDAGLSLCPNVGSCDVTPGLLQDSPFLDDVTDDVLVAIPDWKTSQIDYEAIDVEQTETPAHIVLSYERDLVNEINSILHRAGLRPAKTLEDALTILLLETPPNLQGAVDADISDLFAARPFDAAANFHLPKVEKMKPDINEMPLSSFKSTIATHQTHRAKWRDAVAVGDAELEAGRKICSITNLRSFEYYLRYLSGRRQCMYNGIEHISVVIDKLVNAYHIRLKNNPD